MQRQLKPIIDDINFEISNGVEASDLCPKLAKLEQEAEAIEAALEHVVTQRDKIKAELDLTKHQLEWLREQHQDEKPPTSTPQSGTPSVGW